MTGLRLGPVPISDWPEAVSDLQDGFAGGLNVYRTMAHHPDLLRAWSGLREHIVNKTSLGPQRAEVIVLRTAYRLGSDYEWSQHVVRARNRGLDDRRIAALRGSPGGLAGEDAVLAAAVDELLDHAKLTAPTLAALSEFAGPSGVLDLMATVGFYATLGFILNSFGTPLDDEIASELAATPLRG